MFIIFKIVYCVLCSVYYFHSLYTRKTYVKRIKKNWIYTDQKYKLSAKKNPQETWYLIALFKLNKLNKRKYFVPSSFDSDYLQIIITIGKVLS